MFVTTELPASINTDTRARQRLLARSSQLRRRAALKLLQTARCPDDSRLEMADWLHRISAQLDDIELQLACLPRVG